MDWLYLFVMAYREYAFWLPFSAIIGYAVSLDARNLNKQGAAVSPNFWGVVSLLAWPVTVPLYFVRRYLEWVPQAASQQRKLLLRPVDKKSDAIDVTCNCGKRLRLKAALAGKTGRCPNCNAPLQVPVPELDGFLSDLDQVDPQDSQQPVKAIACACSCGRTFRLHPDKAGRQFDCPACNSKVQVPKQGP